MRGGESKQQGTLALGVCWLDGTARGEWCRNTLADWLEGFLVWSGTMDWVHSQMQEGWGRSDISLCPCILILTKSQSKVMYSRGGRTENQVDCKLGFSLLPATCFSSRNSYCASSVSSLYSVRSSSLNVHLQEFCPPSVEPRWLGRLFSK